MKILLTALLTLATAGCVSNKAYLYDKVSAERFSIEVSAENEQIKGIFENTFKAELLKAGYSIADKSDFKISIIVSKSSRSKTWLSSATAQDFISSVSITLAGASGKIFVQSDYSQSSDAITNWGEQTPIRIARDTARAFVKKIKSS